MTPGYCDDDLVDYLWKDYPNSGCEEWARATGCTSINYDDPPAGLVW
jgi:hypothetical protein